VEGLTTLIIVGGIGFVWFVSQFIKILAEWERGVILRLGRLVGVRGPGIILIFWPVERMIKADLRVFTMDVPAQEVITRDNVTVRLNAVVYFRVLDADKVVTRVRDYVTATSLIAQTTLRSILGQSELDEILSQREQLNRMLQEIIDRQTDPWGVKVSIVEIKDVELPETMKRAMAKQAEAERERRSKVINAEGEFQAAQRMLDAANIIEKSPITIQLRYLQTLREVSAEKSTYVFVPFPLSILGNVQGLLGAGKETKPMPE
jgi:regulator of protease activity HflC (stomatin/prohibitin superfamily)